jgi:hypothetical protein
MQRLADFKRQIVKLLFVFMGQWFQIVHASNKAPMSIIVKFAD